MGNIWGEDGYFGDDSGIVYREACFLGLPGFNGRREYPAAGEKPYVGIYIVGLKRIGVWIFGSLF